MRTSLEGLCSRCKNLCVAEVEDEGLYSDCCGGFVVDFYGNNLAYSDFLNTTEPDPYDQKKEDEE